MPIINDQTPANAAAKNIAAVIDAMTEAQKSQLDLKKAVMMKQISDKMDLAQQAKQQIQTKNINYNYQPGADNSNIASGAPATWANGLNDSGKATNATAGTVGAQPMLPGQPQANPMAPTPIPSPSQTLTAPTQPNAGTGGQPIVPPSPTQAPSNPILNSPASGAGGQPIMPTSIQYNNLGYKPVEAQQLVQTRRQTGQPINMSDRAYVMALQKVKAGTATQGEIDMVHKMNNKDAAGNALPPPGQPAVGGTPVSPGDTALRNMETKLGYPAGSLWRNPETMAPELSPIWKSKMEAQQRAQAIFDQNHPFMEDKRQDGLEKAYADRLAKIVSFRSGGLGVQDQKVNSGVHALALLDQTYDPTTKTFNIPPIMQSELAANVNNAISNQNVTSDQMRQDLQQRSIYGDWNKTMQYLLNTPKNSLPQDNAKLLASMVIRQGPVAEMERDKYIKDLKTMQPSGLDPDRAEKINQIQFGTSFNEQLGKTQFYKDLFANDPKYKDIAGGQSNGSESSAASSAPTIFNPKTGKTMTLSADGKSWQ